MGKASGPDGLEAWGVALAACFITFVMGGLSRIASILFVAFINLFDVDRLQASVPFSARSVTRYLLGPVVGILGQKYGVRAVTVMGGVIGAISSAACFYAKDILWMSVLWGGINGLATAMTLTLPQVVIDQHFKKHRTTASGMVFSGGSIGSFVLPVMLEYLLHTFGLSGSFLIMAGVTLHVIPAAMLLITPSWTSKIETKIETPNINVEENIPTISIEEAPQSNSVANNIEEELRKRITDRHFSGHSNSFLNYEKYAFHKNSVSRVYFTQSSLAEEVFDMRTIDTRFLRENNNLVEKVLTRYDVNKNDELEIDKIQPCVSEYVFHDEIEDLYVSIDRILGKYLLQTEECTGQSSKNNNLCSENTCMKSKHADVNNGKKKIKNKLKLKPNKRGISNDSFLILFHKLVTKDENTILQLFPVEEHESIYKILEQFRHINHLLEHDSNLDFFSNLAAEAKSECNSRKKAVKFSEPSNTFGTHIRTAFRLHANPFFMLISLSRAVHFMTFIPAVTIIVDFSMDKGLLVEEGKYVIAALSFGDLMGRLCLGWVTDREYIGLPRYGSYMVSIAWTISAFITYLVTYWADSDCLRNAEKERKSKSYIYVRYMMFVMMLQGTFTILMAVMYSRITFLITVVVFGLLHGSLFVRHPVLVSRYLGKNEQSVAMGCFNFFSGLLGFTIPSYIGYFRDTVGSYDYIFYINGTIAALVGVLWGFEPLLLKFFKSGNHRQVTV